MFVVIASDEDTRDLSLAIWCYAHLGGRPSEALIALLGSAIREGGPDDLEAIAMLLRAGAVECLRMRCCATCPRGREDAITVRFGMFCRAVLLRRAARMRAALNRLN
jgi:hypothetical protein